MKRQIPNRFRQGGAYLLEALIGILIFAFGVLGIVGLQAMSQRTTTDSSMRAEAVFAANEIIGNMWADAQGTLAVNYSSATGGASYTNWASQLQTQQGGAYVQPPIVDFGLLANANCNPSPSTTSNTVFIEIFWQSPDGVQHNYATCGLVGQNLS